MADNPQVLVLMGSKSDLSVMENTAVKLREMGVSFEMTVRSAHRTPAATKATIEDAESRGVKVIIAAAGLAAHLAGVVASHTVLPVIGVPLPGGPSGGMDALLATVQMPGGIPVATVALGKHGARNAAFLATQILATNDPELRQKLLDHRAGQAEQVMSDAAAVERDHTDHS